MDNKTCVQEITAHRKKFDESILDVAFHPSRPFIASAGADSNSGNPYCNKILNWQSRISNQIYLHSSLNVS